MSGSYGTALIEAERLRQIFEEGYGAEHDNGQAYELFSAAECYTESARAAFLFPGRKLDVPEQWPWHPQYWNPTGNPVLDGKKAGALVAAAIDSIVIQDE